MLFVYQTRTLCAGRRVYKDMKKWNFKLGKLLTPLAAVALLITTVSVNTCCTLVCYQPELPKEARKLRRF